MECESQRDKNKNLSVKEYLDMIRPYLSNIINDHKTQGVWIVHSGNKVIDYKTQGEQKIRLTMLIDVMSSRNSEETHTMHTKSHNAEIVIGNETDDIIKELFKSLLQKYQEGLEESKKGSKFVFDSVDLLHYHLQKTSLKRTGSSYIVSPEWLKNKKATINAKNNDNKSF